jgi:hypothetical protein
MGKYRNGDVLAEVATELYEQTYGGNKWNYTQKIRCIALFY